MFLFSLSSNSKLYKLGDTQLAIIKCTIEKKTKSSIFATYLDVFFEFIFLIK